MRVLGLMLALALAPSPAAAQIRADSMRQDAGPVVRVRIADQAITPVTARYLERAFREADEHGASAMLVLLDTPGGLVQSTRRIVKLFLSSPFPVAVYVSPSGSRAASAGVFITLAAHVAAMAPGTHIGAAHPVQIGGSPGGADTTGSGVMEEKVLNDARAWARSLATLRGRNADWAEAAVSESESITAAEAHDLNVIDLVASDEQELLRMIDGRRVELETKSVRISTAGAAVLPVERWWGERVLGVIADPNVAFLLLMLGFYGLVFEFYSPGWGVAGSVGALAILLGFTGMAVLPINYVGLILILVALGLFVAEAFVPSFGVLTITGVGCLVLGGMMLVDSPTGVVEVSKTVLIPVAIATGFITFFLMGQIVKSSRAPLQTGSESMVGEQVLAVEDFSPSAWGYAGYVSVRGELWTAASDEPIREGEHVHIRSRDGLRLRVDRTSKSAAT